MYKDDLVRLLDASEMQLFRSLRTPSSIQTYLDSLPINFELSGETYMSPRRMMLAKQAHCFEGALFAAAVLAYHGEAPLLLDLKTIPKDTDHVVALFKLGTYWGAISKTNHSILRYRDPVYASPRELALSYFHEYVLDNGKKSLSSYSKPFDLTRYAPKKWVTAGEELQWLVDALDRSRHFPIAPQKNMRTLRRASALELRAQEAVEWKRPSRPHH